MPEDADRQEIARRLWEQTQHGIAEEKASGGEFGISAAGAVGGAMIGIGALSGLMIAGLASDGANRDEGLARYRRFMESVEGCMVSRGYALKGARP